MDKSEYLKNLKVGDVVNRFFHGGGFITEAEKTIVVHIKNNIIWVGEEQYEESYYVKDSVYAYSMLTGEQLESNFGFYHTIELPHAVAPDKEEKNYD